MLRCRSAADLTDMRSSGAWGAGRSVQRGLGRPKLRWVSPLVSLVSDVGCGDCGIGESAFAGLRTMGIRIRVSALGLASCRAHECVCVHSSRSVNPFFNPP